MSEVTGLWMRASQGFGKWGPAHFVPDRRNPETGAWRGLGVTAACGANLYRRSANAVTRSKVRPDDAPICHKCANRSAGPDTTEGGA